MGDFIVTGRGKKYEDTIKAMKSAVQWGSWKVNDLVHCGRGTVTCHLASTHRHGCHVKGGALGHRRRRPTAEQKRRPSHMRAVDGDGQQERTGTLERAVSEPHRWSGADEGLSFIEFDIWRCAWITLLA